MKCLKTLISLSALLFTACGNVPRPLPTELCVIDTKNQMAYCGVVIDGMLDREYDLALDVVDKSTCFRPSEWEKTQNYIDKLRKYIRNNCR